MDRGMKTGGPTSHTEVKGRIKNRKKNGQDEYEKKHERCIQLCTSKGPCDDFSEFKLSFLAIFAGFLSLLPDLHMDGHTERPPYEDTRTYITAPGERICHLLKQSVIMIFFLTQ